MDSNLALFHAEQILIARWIVIGISQNAAIRVLATLIVLMVARTVTTQFAIVPGLLTKISIRVYRKIAYH